MKTIFKIAAIAAITAFMVISCAPPALPKPHNDWLDDYNEQFDAKKYTLNAYNYGFIVSGSLAIGDKAENTIQITISDPNADIFKAEKTALESTLRGFLSFYTFDPAEKFNATDDAFGKPHTLTAFNNWSLVRQNGSTFHLNVTAAFTAKSSRLVYKIDSTKYTYRDGNLMDRDGNGVPGEPVYDDVYGSLSISEADSTYPRLPSIYPMGPGSKPGISVELDDSIPYLSFSKVTDVTTIKGDYEILYWDFGGDAVNSSLQDEVDYLLNLILPGIKLEKFNEGGNWEPAGFTPAIDKSAKGIRRIYIKDFTANHMTAYRLVYEKGSAKLETSKEYYGVIQKLTISLSSNGKTVSGEKTSATRIEGEPGMLWNNSIRNFRNFQETSYSDDSGELGLPTWSYKYTYSWTWSPGWEKEQVWMTTYPNFDYDPYATTDESDDDYDPDVIYPTWGYEDGGMWVDIDDSDYLNFVSQFPDLVSEYSVFHTCIPQTVYRHRYQNL